MVEDLSGPGDEKVLRMLDGESAYAEAIDAVIERAQHSLHIFDVNLARGDYWTARRCDALRAFLSRRRGNQLVVILHQTDLLENRYPRLMLLLKSHAHAFSVRKTDDHARAAADPMVIADGQHYVHRFHHEGTRFLLGFADPEGARPLEGRFEQLYQASFPAVSATTLGL